MMDQTPSPIWTPTPKQAEFLAAPEFEVLYGGRAGGGKTEALIVDALGGSQPGGPAISYPWYRAVLVRPSLYELRDVKERCLQLYQSLVPGVTWLEGKSVFLFPSGAKIELTYLREPADKLRFQGRELQWFGWEELTLHPTGEAYEYLISRMRAKTDSGMACYVRATTNPGGPGHEWVRERFQIDDVGSPNRFKDTIEVRGMKREMWRRFIPAGVEDNPHVDSDYEFKLASMSEQNQRALRHGRWDIVDVEGLVLRDQLQTLHDTKRLVELPIRSGLPVNTFWDIGRDTTAVWFHQREGLWDNFFDFVSVKQQAIVDTAALVKSRGYVFGAHYLPHDAESKSVIAGEKTVRSILEAAGLRPCVVVPRVDSTSTGIELLRQSFDTARIDPNRCKAGLKSLKQYRFKYDAQLGVYSKEPLHNWASHAADAFRQFAQGYRGDRRTFDEQLQAAVAPTMVKRRTNNPLTNPKPRRIV